MNKSSSVVPRLYLGFDPGTDKCGLAIVDDQRSIYWHQIIPTDQVLTQVAELCRKFHIDRLILGNQTSSKQWQQKLDTILPPSLTIVLVDERYSSLEARSRYWELYSPSFWQRLIPLGLRQPPRPVDDIVAIVLVERFLNWEADRLMA